MKARKIGLGLGLLLAALACGLLLTLALSEMGLFAPPPDTAILARYGFLIALLVLTLTVGSHVSRGYLLFTAFFLVILGYPPFYVEPFVPVVSRLFISQDFSVFKNFLMKTTPVFIVLLPAGCIEVLRWEARLRGFRKQKHYGAVQGVGLVFTIIVVINPVLSYYVTTAVVGASVLALGYLALLNLLFAFHLLKPKTPDPVYAPEYD